MSRVDDVENLLFSSKFLMKWRYGVCFVFVFFASLFIIVSQEKPCCRFIKSEAFVVMITMAHGNSYKKPME